MFVPDAETFTELELLVKKVQPLIVALQAPEQTTLLVVCPKLVPSMRILALPLIDTPVFNRVKLLLNIPTNAVEPVMVIPVFNGVGPVEAPTNMEFSTTT